MFRRAVVVAASCVCAQVAHAGQSTCANPGLPIGAAASSDLMPGRLTLSLTTGMLIQDGTDVVMEAGGTIRYDAHLLVGETRLSTEYALTPYLAVGLGVPYRDVRISVDYRDPATGAPLANASSIHIRDEQIAGLGDPTLHVHAAGELGAWRVHGRLGTSVPAGSTEEDPHALGAIGQKHQHVQLGTGTFIPYAALEVQRALRDMIASVWTLARLSLYDNHHGFRQGHRLSAGLTLSSRLGTRAFTFGLASEVHGETAETWYGVEYPDEGNTGRIDVLAGGSVAWSPAPAFAIVGDVRVPVASHIEGTQVDLGPVFGLGIIGTFDLAPRAKWRGLDEAPLGPAGTAAPIVTVPGKLTVIDLWATWCAPCRELDQRLVALVAAHPDRIAVRKLDVGDDESAAWQRYLAPGGFALPHLKVYGPDGALLFEKSAPPEELVRAVEQLLR